MSGPKSLSQHSRRFPWEESSYSDPKVPDRQEWNQRPRAAREDHYTVFKEDDHRRRTPTIPRDKTPGRQEEFYQRHDRPFCDVRNPSPPRGGGAGRGRGGGGIGGGAGRAGGGFSDESRMFKLRGRSPSLSPLRLPRERLPPTPQPQQREAGSGWRREEPCPSHKRFRKLGPGPAGWGDGRRRNLPGAYREQQRGGDGQQERSPPLKRPRREQEEEWHSGRRADFEDFEERHRSQGQFKRHRDRQDAWQTAPGVVEHDHGMARGRPPPQSGPYRREAEEDFVLRRSSHPSSQDGRHERREGGKGGYQHNHDNGANSLGPGDHRDRAPRFGHGPGEPPGEEGYRNPARLHQHQHLHQRPPPEEQQRSSYDSPTDLQGWTEERRSLPWKQERVGGQQQQKQQLLQLPGPQLDPVMPRQRMQRWRREEEVQEQKKTTEEDTRVISEETLTIKVDMSRPVDSSSLLCYSSERQLSLDLVNVGRQRLDFLPMMENSGSARESSARTGTFAQEIIALVHQVREQHFCSSQLTLNQRFSAPPGGATPSSSSETEELTLDQRFSCGRGFSFNTDATLEDEEPPLTCGPLQPVRGPGDLRHDLERRRLERLEGVKVTICGSHSMSQRPLGPFSSDAALEEPEELQQAESRGSSGWPRKHSRRGYSHMGTRRAAPSRRDAPDWSSSGPQHQNHRFQGRLGPVRRQNHRGNQAGPHW